MRKTNNFSWIGRTVATAIMVLALAVFAPGTEAQITLYEYDNVGMWWDALDDDGKERIYDAGDEEAWTALSNAQRGAIELIAERVDATNTDQATGTGLSVNGTQAGITGNFEDDEAWWDSLTCTGRLLAVGKHDGTAATPLNEDNIDGGTRSQTIYCASYDDIMDDSSTALANVVDLVKPRFSGQAASVGFNDVLASESFQSAASSCFRRLRLRSCWLSSASLLR